MDKISAIVATRDRPAMVEEALASILNQTIPPDEIIVADDSETKAAQRLPDNFPVRMVFTGGTGPAVARNAAIREAQHPWLAFCDDDDLWLPQRLAAQQEAMKPNVDLIYGLTTTTESARASMADEATEDAIFHQLLLDNWITTSTVLLRRSAFERAGGFDDRFCPAEDYRLWLAVCRAGRMELIDQPLAAYRAHPGQLQMQVARMFAATAAVVEHAMTEAGIGPHDLDGLAARLRRLYFVQGRTLQGDGDSAGARLAYRRAWSYDRAYLKAPLFHLLSFLKF